MEHPQPGVHRLTPACIAEDFGLQWQKMIVGRAVADGWRIEPGQPRFDGRIGAGDTIHFPSRPHVQRDTPAELVNQAIDHASLLALSPKPFCGYPGEAGLPVLPALLRHHARVDRKCKEVIAQA